MKQNLLFGVFLLFVGAGAGYWYINTNHEPSNDPSLVDDHQSEMCPAHHLVEKDCPWCDRSLISTRGMCQEHGVPEALCSRCNSYLIPGFKAENDWCEEHSLPESQCEICQADQMPPDQTPD